MFKYVSALTVLLVVVIVVKCNGGEKWTVKISAEWAGVDFIIFIFFKLYTFNRTLRQPHTKWGIVGCWANVRGEALSWICSGISVSGNE